MSLSTQMERLMEMKKISRYKLSKETGIPYTTLTQIISGRTKDPQVSALRVLADYFNVSVDYLMGKSVSSIIEERLKEIGMTLPELAKKANVPLTFIKNVDDIVPDHEIDGGEQYYTYLSSIAWILGIPPSKLRVAFARQEIPSSECPNGPISTPEEDFKTLLETYPIGEMVKVPIIGVVTAGPNGLAFEDYQGEAPVDTSYINGDHFFYLQVKGDSMIGDGILPGDLALVRETPEVEYGVLAIAIVNGEEGTIKRVYKNGDSIILQASNPKYPPRIFKGEDMKNIRIVGEVKMTTRRY
ncbi:MAG: helix-turn-helix domain-containing protein [Desulfitobacterium hafniense]|nr:helix-turn-helix domain-containing protein [Desulfitobacterium hafniense]